MHIVDLMTTDTGAAQRHFSRHGFVVAGVAGEAIVSAVELEGSLLVVIEAPGLPRQGVVAGFAARPERVLVLVVFLVTGDARRLQLFFI